MTQWLQLEQGDRWVSDEGMITLAMDAHDRVAVKAFYLVAPIQAPFLERARRALGL